jgi:hypothetical protein
MVEGSTQLHHDTATQRGAEVEAVKEVVVVMVEQRRRRGRRRLRGSALMRPSPKKTRIHDDNS